MHVYTTLLIFHWIFEVILIHHICKLLAVSNLKKWELTCMHKRQFWFEHSWCLVHHHTGQFSVNALYQILSDNEKSPRKVKEEVEKETKHVIPDPSLIYSYKKFLQTSCGCTEWVFLAGLVNMSKMKLLRKKLYPNYTPDHDFWLDLNI